MTTGQIIDLQLDELDTVRSDLITTLESKGIEVNPDAKLDELVNDVDQLKNPVGELSVTTNGSFDVTDYATVGVDVDTTYHWERPSDWWDTKTILQNAENIIEGADTFYPGYIMLLDDTDDETVFNYNVNYNSLYGDGYLTSDGSWYNTQTATHTWDRTKDKDCSEGYKTRYVIVYSKIPNANNKNFSIASFDNCLELIVGNIKLSRLQLSWAKGKNMSKDAYATNYTIRNVEVLDNSLTVTNSVYAEFCTGLQHFSYPTLPSALSGYTFYDCISIKEINLPNCTGVGAGEFYRCYSLETLNAPKLSSIAGDSSGTYSTFGYCYKLKKLSIIEGSSQLSVTYNPFSASYLSEIIIDKEYLGDFGWSASYPSLEKLYIKKYLGTSTTATSCNLGPILNSSIKKFIFKDVIGSFGSNIKTIGFSLCGSGYIQYADFTGFPNISITLDSNGSFFGQKELTEVYLPENYKYTAINLSSSKIKVESLRDILNKLADVTGESTTYTLTLGTKNRAKLTDDEVAIATNKGWVVN